MASMDPWDRKFLELARHIGGWSKDRSRGVGCVIAGPHHEIRSTGYNGFPRGILDGNETRHEKPAKYSWTEHAERNAIYNAARAGTPLEGCTAYVPLFPCMDCARGLLQSGLVRLVTMKPDFDDPQWGSQFKLVVEMLDEVNLSSGFHLTLVSPEQLAP